jgi:hypothetical protein
LSARSLGFALYADWDRRHREADGDPLELVAGSRILAGVPTVRIDSRDDPKELAITLDRIRDAQLDVVLDFSGRGGDDVPWPAAFGVWRLQVGDPAKYPSDPDGFWEVRAGDPLTVIDLRAVLPGGGTREVALCRGVLATAPGWSWHRNRQAAYWGARTYFIQKLFEVQEHGWERAQVRAIPVEGSAAEPKGRTETPPPSSWETLTWLVPTILSRGAAKLGRSTTRAEWRMAIRRSPTSLIDRLPHERLEGFHWLSAPAGRWHADPFLVRADGQDWVFFEDASAGTGLGRLVVAGIQPSLRLGDQQTVLERPQHLSYPHVFRAADEWFMIPETFENRTVELLRCRRFPGDWAVETVLLQVPAVDSTIWTEEQTCWLFVTTLDPRSLAMQLLLFSATSVTGPWRPHRQNPISTDVRNARGAGAIFRHNGRLYRPSQDCSVRYGRNFSLNEITRLDEAQYQELPVVTVEPLAGFVGTHTFARSGHLEMIDGCVLVEDG